MSQHYKNHRQFVPGFHLLTLLLIVALLGGAIANLVITTHENLYSASLILLIAVILGLLYFFIRRFPIRAQDRAIRAEESLRHFILTGKPMDTRLRLGQIIALRFASDAEYPELSKKAVAEELGSNEIKKLIKDWRADYHRV